jgi:hypothetical protein
MVETLRRPRIDDTIAAGEPQALSHRDWSAPGTVAAWVTAAVVALLHLAGAAHNPTPMLDEGTYTAQAWAVLHLGRLAPYTYWYDHPPLGWISLAGLGWLLAPLLPHGLDAVAQLRLVLWLWTLVSLAALVGTARRLGWRPAAAVVAVLVWGFPPLPSPWNASSSSTTSRWRSSW